MKENSPQLMASTDSVGTQRHKTTEDFESPSESYGSFVALKRLSKLEVEAVRMQGCADGAGAWIDSSNN